MNILHKIRHSYLWLFKPHFLAGERAERYFEALCEGGGYILERISQDRRSFARYAANARNRVKRGDYIVRNLGNAEVEVKCYSRRRYGSAPCYRIEYRQLKRHEEMERLTGAPVIFAIFERSGRNVVENSLRMIPLKELTYRRHRGVFYDGKRKSLCVPLGVMYPAFEYFETYKALRDDMNRTSVARGYAYARRRA